MFVRVYETVPDSLAREVKMLLRECFQSVRRTPEWIRKQADAFCSQGDALWHVVALQDDEHVIGFATAYRRTIAWRGRAVVLGGLGHVCTDPAHRRSGIATAVVAAAMGELEAAGCNLAYLCAEVDNPGIVGLYGQVGFVPLRRPHSYFGKSGALYTAVDGMIAPVTSPALFDDVLNDREPFHIGTGNW